jgi:hypothetical protein
MATAINSIKAGVPFSAFREAIEVTTIVSDQESGSHEEKGGH